MLGELSKAICEATGIRGSESCILAAKKALPEQNDMLVARARADAPTTRAVPSEPLGRAHSQGGEPSTRLPQSAVLALIEITVLSGPWAH